MSHFYTPPPPQKSQKTKDFPDIFRGYSSENIDVK